MSVECKGNSMKAYRVIIEIERDILGNMIGSNMINCNRAYEKNGAGFIEKINTELSMSDISQADAMILDSILSKFYESEVHKAKLKCDGYE